MPSRCQHVTQLVAYASLFAMNSCISLFAFIGFFWDMCLITLSCFLSMAAVFYLDRIIHLHACSFLLNELSLGHDAVCLKVLVYVR